MPVAKRRWRGRSAAAATIVACLAGTPGASAQTPTAAQPAAKRPAPPLFPRHRRGIYRNTAGIEVIDATPQSPPLDTDDPGVPDQGEYEINVTTRGDYAGGTRRLDVLLIDAN